MVDCSLWLIFILTLFLFRNQSFSNCLCSFSSECKYWRHMATHMDFPVIKTRPKWHQHELRHGNLISSKIKTKIYEDIHQQSRVLMVDHSWCHNLILNSSVLRKNIFPVFFGRTPHMNFLAFKPYTSTRLM